MYDETNPVQANPVVPHGLTNKHIVFIYERCRANKTTDINTFIKIK